MLPLCASKQAVDNLPLVQAAEKWDVLRRVQKIQEPGTGAEQLYPGFAEHHAACPAANLGHSEFFLAENLAHHGHFELEYQSQDGFLNACAYHLADHRQINCGQLECRLIAKVRSSADVNTLLSLGINNKRGLVRRRSADGRCGSAEEGQARYRRDLVAFNGDVCRDLEREFSSHFNDPGRLVSARIVMMSHHGLAR